MTPTPTPGSRPRRDAGFTLLEMLVVMALIGVLMGMGVGFLRRKGDALEVALASVRDQVRIASLTARSRHLPSEVVIDPGQDGPATVRARVLEPVGHWHMEEDPRDDESAGLPSSVTGLVEPGRFGMARRFDPDARAPLLYVQAGDRPVFDLRDGFSVRVDLRLDERFETTVARFGTSFELRLNDDLVPSAKMVGTEGGGRAGPSVSLAGKLPLSLGTWHTLQAVHDGRFFRLLVDDREVDSADANLPILQTPKDGFEVSPAADPVPGLVDEVMVMAYAFSEPMTLPIGVRIASDPWIIAFDRQGDLVEPVRFILAIDEDERTYRVGPGGIVE